MKKNKMIIWSTDISDLIDGKASGIAVQLFYWAQVFVKEGWQVTSFTFHKSFFYDGVVLRKKSDWGRLEIFHEWITILYFILTIHPSIIITRGASRTSYPLVVLSELFGVKYVFFGASDANFETNEHVSGGSHNIWLYKKAVKKMRYVVVQNQYQHDTLKENYGKEGYVLYNLWGDFSNSVDGIQEKTDVIWVANFARLKRAEWMVNAAKAMPEFDFTLIGGKYKGQEDYYNEIKQLSKEVKNIHFLGKKSFAESNTIVSKARVLCCTSTFEGFPNTFLQAWSNDIPVVSTVNPSNVITTYGLGAVVENEEDFQESILQLLQDKSYYSKVSGNIHDYFMTNHAAENVYKKLMTWLDGNDLK